VIEAIRAFLALPGVDPGELGTKLAGLAAEGPVEVDEAPHSAKAITD
jgi:hypothetical protein